MPAPMPDDFADRLRALHGRGLSRNQIAKELGCAVATVTKHAKRLGLSFDRASTAAAVEARVIDMKARRLAIIDRLYTRAEVVLARLEASEYQYRVTYKEESEIVTDDAPPANDERALQAAIAGHLNAAIRLAEIDADGGESEVRSMLARLGEELGIRAAS